MLNKIIILNFLKIILLFVSGLYLLGFVWFPFFGYGNYLLINVDLLLPTEWVFISVIAVIEIVWSFNLIFKLWKCLY
jgi:hypothetical protein